MKTKLIKSLAIFSAVLLAGNVSAALLPYDDFRDIDVLDLLIPTGPQGGLSGILDVKVDDGDAIPSDIYGFDPSSYVVTNVALAFSFYELVSTNNGFQRIWSRVDADLNLGDAGFFPGQSPSESGDFLSNIFEFNYVIDSSLPVNLSLIADVQADGQISWGVSVGDATGIYLFAAALGVEAHRIPARDVPDTGTSAAMFGLGLFGIAAVSRRIRFSAAS